MSARWGLVESGDAFRPAELAVQFGRATDEIQLNVAKLGYRVIHQYMKADFKHPTGHYRSRVLIDATRADLMLTDGGVIYNTWLEGESGRNAASRFKGYHMFRRTTQAVDAQATRIANETLAPYLRRFG